MIKQLQCFDMLSYNKHSWRYIIYIRCNLEKTSTQQHTLKRRSLGTRCHLDWVRYSFSAPKLMILPAASQNYRILSLSKISIQTPITLARKIVSQNIVSKCRALLSLQPIKQSDAELLDKMITAKVHEMLRFPFCPQTNILTLPLSRHGLDFPSIARVNAGIAAEGISIITFEHTAKSSSRREMLAP